MKEEIRVIRYRKDFANQNIENNNTYLLYLKQHRKLPYELSHWPDISFQFKDCNQHDEVKKTSSDMDRNSLNDMNDKDDAGETSDVDKTCLNNMNNKDDLDETSSDMNESNLNGIKDKDDLDETSRDMNESSLNGLNDKGEFNVTSAVQPISTKPPVVTSKASTKSDPRKSALDDSTISKSEYKENLNHISLAREKKSLFVVAFKIKELEFLISRKKIELDELEQQQEILITSLLDNVGNTPTKLKFIIKFLLSMGILLASAFFTLHMLFRFFGVVNKMPAEETDSTISEKKSEQPIEPYDTCVNVVVKGLSFTLKKEPVNTENEE